MIAGTDAVDCKVCVAAHAESEHQYSGDEEIAEAHLAAGIEEEQRSESVPIEDVARPDEVEVEDTEKNEPHVAAEEDVGHVFAAAPLGAFRKRMTPAPKSMEKAARILPSNNTQRMTHAKRL